MLLEYVRNQRTHSRVEIFVRAQSGPALLDSGSYVFKGMLLKYVRNQRWLWYHARLMKRLTLIQRAREVFIDCDERFSLIGYMVRLRIFNRGGGLHESERRKDRKIRGYLLTTLLILYVKLKATTYITQDILQYFQHSPLITTWTCWDYAWIFQKLLWAMLL